MANYSNLGTDGTKLISELEYKTLFGYPSAKTNSSFAADAATDSRLHIQSEQVWLSNIPKRQILVETECTLDTTFGVDVDGNPL